MVSYETALSNARSRRRNSRPVAKSDYTRLEQVAKGMGPQASTARTELDKIDDAGLTP